MGRHASLQREQFARCFGVNLAKARGAADVSQDELAFRTSDAPHGDQSDRARPVPAWSRFGDEVRGGAGNLAG